MAALSNDRHERFCQEYLIDLVAGRAYERAGYKARGNAAEVNGSKLLRNAKVAARIAELKAARQERTQVKADDVVRELARIGFSDVTHYVVTGEGTLDLTEGSDPLETRAVQSIKFKTKTYRRGDDDVQEVDTEIRLWSKTAALDSLAKHLGIYEKDNGQKAASFTGVVFAPPGSGAE